MELSHMSIGITKMIKEKYNEYIDDDCLDIVQIGNICNLYKTKSSKARNSISLSEITFSTPDFQKTKIDLKKIKKQLDILKTKEFQKKYAFFIRIIYSSLKIGVEIFDISDMTVSLKNNYRLIKSIEQCKKKLIEEHVNILKNHYKNISVAIDNNYDDYIKSYLVKVKILDKIIASINKLINGKVFDKTDNLFSLILPYFYTYTEYIEEYN